MPNGTVGDHPLTDIIAHGIEVFSPGVDATVRELRDLGSFNNEIASYWLLDVRELLREARSHGQAVHHGRPLSEEQVLGYIEGVLNVELTHAQRERG
jgi:hypothetical protein